MNEKKRRKNRGRTGFSRLQIARTITRCAVVLFFILIPLHNWYANNKISYNQARLVGLAWGTTAEYVYQAMDAFYSFFWDDPVLAATSNNGSLWAFTAFGVDFSDPVGVLSHALNAGSFSPEYFYGALAPLLLVLLFGRAFCSWLCPMSLLFSFTKRVRAVAERVGIPTLSLTLPKETGGWVLLGGLFSTHIFGAWIWHFVLPYITFSHEIFSYIVFSTFTSAAYYLLAVLVLDIGLLNGAFCASICPTGWALSQAGRLSFFKLKADAPNCPPNCRQCAKACPIDLFPKEGKLYSCHLCLKCVANCPKNHIRIEGLTKRKKKANHNA